MSYSMMVTDTLPGKGEIRMGEDRGLEKGVLGIEKEIKKLSTV
jgi:hypothetical protein